MSFIRIVGAAALAVVVAPAPAGAFEPHAFGVGPHLGTKFLPGAYPSGLPRKISRYDFDGDGRADDLDGDGTRDASALEKVRADVELGADAHLWLDETHRLGLSPGLDLGAKYTDMRVMLVYDYLFEGGSLNPFVGGGVGAGSATWRTDGEERLRVPYYPLRVSSGIVIPDALLGYQARVIGQWDIPARHIYVAGDGREKKVGPGLYLSLGIEVTVLFGSMPS